MKDVKLSSPTKFSTTGVEEKEEDDEEEDDELPPSPEKKTATNTDASKENWVKDDDEVDD